MFPAQPMGQPGQPGQDDPNKLAILQAMMAQQQQGGGLAPMQGPQPGGSSSDFLKQILSQAMNAQMQQHQSNIAM